MKSNRNHPLPIRKTISSKPSEKSERDANLARLNLSNAIDILAKQPNFQKKISTANNGNDEMVKVNPHTFVVSFLSLSRRNLKSISVPSMKEAVSIAMREENIRGQTQSTHTQVILMTIFRYSEA